MDYIGTYGGAPMSPLRHPAKAMVPRSLIAVLVRLVQRHTRARRRTRATVLKFPTASRRAEDHPHYNLHLQYYGGDMASGGTAHCVLQQHTDIDITDSRRRRSDWG
jgi:hypothetical protein